MLKVRGRNPGAAGWPTILELNNFVLGCAASDEIYHVRMQFGGTVLYVDGVKAIVDFYRRTFGLGLRFFDEALGFAELDTGGSVLAFASHSLGETLMPGGYSRPAVGDPPESRSPFSQATFLLPSLKRLLRARPRSHRQGACPGVWKSRTSERPRGL